MSHVTRRSALATLASAGLTLPTLLHAQPRFASLQEQPHMKAALEALESAKKHLDEAEADKAGHRKNAIEHVERAIKEVRMGIEAGEKPEGKHEEEKKKP